MSELLTPIESCVAAVDALVAAIEAAEAAGVLDGGSPLADCDVSCGFRVPADVYDAIDAPEKRSVDGVGGAVYREKILRALPRERPGHVLVYVRPD